MNNMETNIIQQPQSSLNQIWDIVFGFIIVVAWIWLTGLAVGIAHGYLFPPPPAPYENMFYGMDWAIWGAVLGAVLSVVSTWALIKRPTVRFAVVVVAVSFIGFILYQFVRTA